ncbi:P-loop containing nucleoside triphosphate hydrolase [Arabidopsis suecica]|uniref:P-loop containing nucleoside triphosphate hydrolase n=1 Tax=Arabidopsis suecica TaxID=45249 RepID=A0A8T2H9K4_ARASU|nr:P-loop containing nucleoside triphosphate hydrolase [Arabidopsis suecica]
MCLIVRCGGLPLAITVLGGLLATKSTWNEWQRVYENIKSYVSNGGSSNGKGMVMPVKHTEASTTVEDVGQDYLEELVKRSMVMVGRRDIVTSEVMTCHLDPKTKLDLSTLRNLEHLWDFPVGKCNPRDLLAMTSLRRLSINLSSQNTDFEVVSSLSKVLKRLRGLTINVPCEPMLPPVDVTQLVSAFTNLCELELFLKLEKLPGEQSFSSDLGALRLWQCGLVDDPFMVLEKLPNLKILQLFEGSFVGRKLCCSKNGFPQLHSLTLSQLENLEEWTVEDGAMMRLVSMELKCCNKLKSVPEGTRF